MHFGYRSLRSCYGLDLTVIVDSLCLLILCSVILKAEGLKQLCNGPTDRLVNGTCFKYYNTFMNWTDAKAECEAQGYVLATVNSSSQIQEIISNQGIPDQAWIGANDLAQKGKYVWVADNRPATELTNMWGVGEPNDQFGIEDCVTAVVTSRVNDAPCNVKFPYICMNLRKVETKAHDVPIIILAIVIPLSFFLVFTLTAFVAYKVNVKKNQPSNWQHGYDSLGGNRNDENNYNDERYAKVNTHRAPMKLPPREEAADENLYDYISDDLTDPKELLRSSQNSPVPYYNTTDVTLRRDNVQQTLPKLTGPDYVVLI